MNFISYVLETGFKMCSIWEISGWDSAAFHQNFYKNKVEVLGLTRQLSIAVFEELPPFALIQQARLRSSVWSFSRLRFFQIFSSAVRQMSGKLGHVRPRVSFGYHHSKPYSSIYGRPRSLTLVVVSDRRR